MNKPYILPETDLTKMTFNPVDVFLQQPDSTVTYVYPASKNPTYSPDSVVKAVSDLKERLKTKGPVPCGFPFEPRDFPNYKDYAQNFCHPKQQLLNLMDIEVLENGDWLLTFTYSPAIMETHSNMLNHSKLGIVGTAVGNMKDGVIKEDLAVIYYFQPLAERNF